MTKTKQIFSAILLFLALSISFVYPEMKFNFNIAKANWVDDVKDIFSDPNSDKKIINFSDFQGGLTPPSTEGYAPGLVQATDARTYIRQVVNFILGFLGLAAIIIIIYGGFSMVLSGGNSEKMEIGKKSVTYAVIGILLIMGSFAFVNTILRAPTGTDGITPTGGTVALKGSGEAKNLNQLAARMEALINRLKNVTQLHYQVLSDLELIRKNLNYSIPSNPFYNLYTNCYGNFSAENACNKWNGGIGKMLADYRSYVVTQSQLLDRSINSPYANIKLIAYLQKFKSDLVNTVDQSFALALNYARSVDCFNDDCSKKQKKIEGIFDNFKNNNTKIDSIIYKEITSSENPIFSSYSEDIEKIKDEIGSIWSQVKNLTTAYIGLEKFNSLITITIDTKEYNSKSTLPGFLFNDLIAKSKSEFKVSDSGLSSRQETLKVAKDSIAIMSELVELLKNIKFVNVNLTADTTSGNAPLVVAFSTVGSTDPSGQTIDNSKITWDIDGDDNFNENNINGQHGILCDENSSSTKSCIFTKPGSYIIKAKIDPAKTFETKIAPGISTLNISVNPPATKINLSYSIGQQKQEEWISAYCSGSDNPLKICTPELAGFLVLDKQKIFVTTSEARDLGITFNAEKTVTSGNNPIISPSERTGNARVRWDFGPVNPQLNLTELPTSASLVKNNVKYPGPGSYPVTIEVTDKNGITDRKIFTVVVSENAPRLSLETSEAKINEEVLFDASASSSAVGQNPIFNWNLTRGQDNPPPLKNFNPSTDEYDCQFNQSRDQMRCKFKIPGEYTASLHLNDETQNKESVSIKITSAKPIAGFTVNQTKSNTPSIYELDARSLSYDPDYTNALNSTAKIGYIWEITPSTCEYFTEQTPGEIPTTKSCKGLTELDPKETTSLGKIFIKFNQKGKYQISLRTISTEEPNNPSLPSIQDLEINNLLDLYWGTTQNGKQIKDFSPVAKLSPEGNQVPVAPLEFSFFSTINSAVSYEIDFGDGTARQTDILINGAGKVTHKYTKAGRFNVRLCLFDNEDNENCATRKVTIGQSDKPTAVIRIFRGNEELFPNDKNIIEISKQDQITFEAGSSINTDGSTRRLRYQWDFGNGKNSTQKTAFQTYSDAIVSQSDNDKDLIKAKLVVTNEENIAQIGEDSVNFKIISLKPTLSSLTAVPVSSKLTTPVQVNLSAIGAKDPDGKIIQYRWWYEQLINNQPDGTRRGLQITTAPQATLTVGTSGLENEQKTYAFFVEMTDDENQKVTTTNLTNTQNSPELIKTLLPTITVTNGPNKAPIASFTVDRTSVFIGEPVNFASNSTDPDVGGSITSYAWDFGDKIFRDKDPQGKLYGPNPSFTFTKANPEGYSIRLRVTDNNDTTSVSTPIKIFVDSNAEKPVAKFTYTQRSNALIIDFKNNSTLDQSKGIQVEKIYWDFDTSVDEDGNGKTDDDEQAIGQNAPSYQYQKSGVYRVKLTIIDTSGQKASVTTFVSVKGVQTAYLFTSSFNTANGIPTLAMIILCLGFFGLILHELNQSKKHNK